MIASGRAKSLLPSVDVIFPVSAAWLGPYLENACASIRDQEYPQDLIKIYISYFYDTPPVDISSIISMCCDLEAVIMFNRWSDPVWNIGKAYNLAARCGQRDVIACFDADVVFHPQTFRYAARHLIGGTSAVVPVARTPHEPESDIFRIRNDRRWREVSESFRDQRVGVGNIMVPRWAFEEIHGFDERLHGWGMIDTDLYYRLMKRSGTVYLSDEGCPKAMHQKHRKTPTKNSKYTKRNEQMVRGAKKIVRNPHKWGGLRVLEKPVVQRKR